jgi:hypothetical protein
MKQYFIYSLFFPTSDERVMPLTKGGKEMAEKLERKRAIPSVPE